MTRNQIIDHYAEKKVAGNMDLAKIKRALREKHKIAESDIPSIIDAIVANELDRDTNRFQSYAVVRLTIIGLALMAVGLCVYYMLNPIGTTINTILTYACLLGGIYIVYKNVRALLN